MRRHSSVRTLNNQRGNLIFSLGLTAVFSFIAVTIIGYTVNQVKVSIKAKQHSQYRLMLASSIETFVTAVRHAEANYFIQIRNCGAANLFLASLFEGHQCESLKSSSFKIFTKADLTGLNSSEQDFFDYSSGWNIRYDAEATGPSDRKILTLKMQTVTVDFFLNGSFTAKDRSDFTAVMRTSQGTFTNQFSVFTTDSPNKMHLNASDVKMTVQKSYAKDACANTPWATYSIYINGTCVPVANLGGGMGLAYYGGDYFGLRPGDGQIVSLSSVSTGPTYMVNEDGTMGGKKVFVPYSKESLINVDDIEVVGEDQGKGQIYAVRGAGEDTEIAYYDSVTKTLNTICKIGEQQMGRSFSGLSSVPGNQNLLDASGNLTSSVASFYLKADNGDNVYALIKVVPSGTSLDAVEAAFKTAINGRTAICSVVKSKANKEIENSRTLGLTRGGVVVRPYMIY